MNDFESLSERLSYSQVSGEIVWRKSPNRRHPVGSAAGSVDRQGYVRLWIRLADGRRRNCAAHRIAWLLTYGVWPMKEIDHINGVRSDNRIENLRDVSRTLNMMNRHGPDIDSRTGILGVSITPRGKFLAQRCGRYLGVFDCPLKAQAAYQAALSIEKTREAA